MGDQLTFLHCVYSWFPNFFDWSPTLCIDPQPVVLFLQIPLAPSILIQCTWIIYQLKAKNWIYKMVYLICYSVDICLWKQVIYHWNAIFYGGIKLLLKPHETLHLAYSASAYSETWPYISIFASWSSSISSKIVAYCKIASPSSAI